MQPWKSAQLARQMFRTIIPQASAFAGAKMQLELYVALTSEGQHLFIIRHRLLATSECANSPVASAHLHNITDAHACDVMSSNMFFKLSD